MEQIISSILDYSEEKQKNSSIICWTIVRVNNNMLLKNITTIDNLIWLTIEKIKKNNDNSWDIPSTIYVHAFVDEKKNCASI